MAHVVTGRTLTFTGRFAEARSHLEKADALYDQISLPRPFQPSGLAPRVGTDGYLAIVLFCLGYPDEAVAKTRANLAYAVGIAHTPSIVLAHVFGATLFALVGDDIALQGEVQKVVSLAKEHGFALYLAQGTIFKGWLEIRSGNLQEGLHLLRDGLDAYRSTGSLVWMPQYLGILALAYETAGRIEEALAQVGDALRIVDRTGERWFAAELNRYKGHLLLRQGSIAAAEELFCEALRIAQTQGAKLWKLRAAMSLARLRRDQGRCSEAGHLLKSAYGCFTEGFATPDLEAARKLLEELRDHR
jgi:predicted ATPase